MKRNLLLLTLLSTLLTAAPSNQDEQAIAKGNEISSALLQKLGGEVKAKMQAGGPLAAVHFCSQNALVLTDELAKQTHTGIKRVSLKNRNPVNAADTEEQEILRKWEKMTATGESLPPYEFKRTTDNKSIFYKPIVLNNEACLKCHGELAAGSDVAATIRSLYPDDKATGYKMGDLRGMIVITLPQ